MAINFLKLNDDKNWVLVHRVYTAVWARSVWQAFRIGNSSISAASSVLNLGATFDTTMSVEMRVNNTCHSAMATLRNIIDIRPSLAKDATEKVVHVLVTSRLDSSEVLLYGHSVTQNSEYPKHCSAGSV